MSRRWSEPLLLVGGASPSSAYCGQFGVRSPARKGTKLTPSQPAGSADELWAWFVQRVRLQLHVVLCMSPIGDVLRSRLRQFPSLINCSTIDWCVQPPPRRVTR